MTLFSFESEKEMSLHCGKKDEIVQIIESKSRITICIEKYITN